MSGLGVGLFRYVSTRRWLALGQAVVLVASVVTFGVPPTLMLIGVWVLSAVTGRLVPSLSGMVTWAAGLIIEAALLCALSAALALVHPHTQPQWLDVATLLLPLVVGAVLWWWCRPRSVRAARLSGPLRSTEPWLALVIILLVEAMFEAIKLHGHDFGIAWVMNGDARNHVALNRAILNDGGLTLAELKAYPAVVNALCAILAGAGGRAGVPAGVLMVRDVQAMAATFVLSTIAIATLFVAALGETIPLVGERVKRVAPTYYVALVISGSMAMGAFVLGLSVSGGFLSGIGAIALTMAAVVLGLRAVREPHPVTVLLLAASVALVVLSWTVLVVIPAGSLLLALVALGVSTRRDRLTSTRAWRRWCLASMAAALLLCVALGVELYLNRGQVLTILKSVGGIVPPNPGEMAWVGAAAVLVFALAPSGRQRIVRGAILLVYLCGAAGVLWLRHIEPSGVSWSYYATKMLWLCTSCVIWVPFVLATDAVTYAGRVRALGGWRHGAGVTVSAALCALMVWFATVETPFPVPFTFSFEGSTYPSPAAVTLLVHEANQGGPFVVWDYSGSYVGPVANQFNDQISNFWSALAWGYEASGTPVPWGHFPYSFEAWAYVETSATSSLCQVLHKQTIRIVTSDPQLRKSLLASCRAYRLHQSRDPVVVVPAPTKVNNPLTWG